MAGFGNRNGPDSIRFIRYSRKHVRRRSRAIECSLSLIHIIIILFSFCCSGSGTRKMFNHGNEQLYGMIVCFSLLICGERMFKSFQQKESVRTHHVHINSISGMDEGEKFVSKVMREIGRAAKTKTFPKCDRSKRRRRRSRSETQ